MNTTKTAVLTVLVLVNVAFVLGWIRAARRHGLRERPTLGDVAIGVVTDFLDTLGIGSFAPTTSIFKLKKLVPDENIPGTLNVGHNASAFLETTLFVTSMLPRRSGLPRRAIQRFMGVALLIAALFFVMRNLGAFPGGGEAFALEGWRFAVAVGISFLLGALMCIGIGNYAPLMIMLALLGMHPLAAFPIMMASDGILQPVASLGFFRSGRFAHGPSLGLLAGGVVGVLIAFPLVSKLPLYWLRWLVVAVVTYAAISMLRSAYAEARAAAPAAAVERG